MISRKKVSTTSVSSASFDLSPFISLFQDSVKDRRISTDSNALNKSNSSGSLR